MRRGHGKRGAALAVAAIVALGAAAPAAQGAVVDPPAAHAAAKKKKSKVKATRVALAAPSQGDISYSVVQVRIGKTAKVNRVPKGRQVLKAKKIGGVKIAADSSAWKKLKRSTKVFVAVSPVPSVNGPDKSLRNVVVFAQRRMGAKSPGAKGKITLSLANARPEVGSFWVRAPSKGGSVQGFHVRNAITTAVDNWSRYIGALQAANAMRAAMNPVDKNGTFKPKASVAQSGSAKNSFGGHKQSALTRRAAGLIFETMRDRVKIQEVKKDPVFAQYIATELKNPALAAKWTKVVAELPTLVPDQYAAAAKEEAKLQKITPVKISRTRVVIADHHNASDAASREFQARSALTDVAIMKVGSGTGEVTQTNLKDYINNDFRVPWLKCGTFCARAFTASSTVELAATPAQGSKFVGWAGCNRVQTEAIVTGFKVPVDACDVYVSATQTRASRTVVARFDRIAPAGGGGNGGSGGSGGGGSTGGGGGNTEPKPGQILTFGSDLSRAADSVESHQQDSIYFNEFLPTDRSVAAPATGQVLKVRIRGAARKSENGTTPDALGRSLSVQVLRKNEEGVRYIPPYGGTSARFEMPVAANSNDARDRITEFEPENLCVGAGDAIALNSIGGWDGSNPGSGGFNDGVPFQMFGAGPGAMNNQFHKHDGLNNGAHIEGGVGDDLQPTEDGGPVQRANQELLMEVIMGTGSNATALCPGGTYVPPQR